MKGEKKEEEEMGRTTSPDKTGVEAEQEVTPFPCIVIWVMKDRNKFHNKRGMSFLECRANLYPA